MAAMSTFYLMPSRTHLGRRFAAFLSVWFPGVHIPANELPELLAATVERGADVIVLFADDLPSVRGEMLDDSLCDGFGGESGDRVIDLRVGPIDGVAAETHIIGTDHSLLRFNRITKMAG